jgi:KDO2-lipid IV(A) lauroyltransferase
MRLLYYVIYSLWFLLSLLPLRIHYMLSDLLYLIIYRLIHYRVAVVRKNIQESFPEKDADEQLAIERGFYHWFCDYLAESVKLLTMSRSQMRRRMVFKGTDVVDEVVRNGQSCAVYLGHYCNWEWITSLPLWVTPEAQCGQIYHVLENQEFDKLFLKLRQRWGAVCIPMAETLRRLIQYRQANQPVVIGYIGDQVPFWNNIHHWCHFLNHDTPVLTGTERLARQTGQAAFYLDVRRLRRGYYEAEFKLITREPKQLAEFELTDIYFRMLEESIRRDPACYLWSHNRWKRTREEFNLRYDPDTGRVDIISSVEELKKKKGL